MYQHIFHWSLYRVPTRSLYAIWIRISVDGILWALELGRGWILQIRIMELEILFPIASDRMSDDLHVLNIDSIAMLHVEESTAQLDAKLRSSIGKLAQCGSSMHGLDQRWIDAIFQLILQIDLNASELI